MEITIRPDFTDATQFVRIGPIPNTFVQTSVLWMPYAQGGFQMIDNRLGKQVTSGALGEEINAGVHAVTIMRLGDIYGKLFNTAVQDFRYTAAGVRDATRAVAWRPIPEPVSFAMIATAAIGCAILRRPH